MQGDFARLQGKRPLIPAESPHISMGWIGLSLIQGAGRSSFHSREGRFRNTAPVFLQGHSRSLVQCPLSGSFRTSTHGLLMSPTDPERTSRCLDAPAFGKASSHCVAQKSPHFVIQGCEGLVGTTARLGGLDAVRVPGDIKCVIRGDLQDRANLLADSLRLRTVRAQTATSAPASAGARALTALNGITAFWVGPQCRARTVT
jgi:hypothetical protein